MRVVSLVPSWTETLLEAGVEVVGRTRFCIHGPGVEQIPKIGGTKDWDFEKIKRLTPDILILDREENPKFMSEQNEIPFHATHVQSLKDMPRELRDLGEMLKNSKLCEMATAFEKLPAKIPPNREAGIIESHAATEYTEAVYMIWKDPWMAAGSGTYIASVLEYCGYTLAEVRGKYPVIDLKELDPSMTLLIFSSEPYPFLKKRDGLRDLGFQYVIADGEKFSWFGVRSLRFLTSLSED